MLKLAPGKKTFCLIKDRERRINTKTLDSIVKTRMNLINTAFILVRPENLSEGHMIQNHFFLIKR